MRSKRGFPPLFLFPDVDRFFRKFALISNYLLTIKKKEGIILIIITSRGKVKCLFKQFHLHCCCDRRANAGNCISPVWLTKRDSEKHLAGFPGDVFYFIRF